MSAFRGKADIASESAFKHTGARRKLDRRYCFSARSVRGCRSVSPGFDGTDDAAAVTSVFVVAMDDAATVRSADNKIIDGRERRLPCPARLVGTIVGLEPLFAETPVISIY